VEYRTDTWIIRKMPLYLLLCLAGLALVVYADGKGRAGGWVLLAAGVGLTGFALYRQARPGRPVLTLSPGGLLLRAGGRATLVPWREVHGVETVDLKVRNRVRGITVMAIHRDCTVVLVSQAFYEAHLDVGSVFLRGPAWDNVFVPRGEMVQVALHHEQLSVSPREVREPIEARWRAFGRGDGGHSTRAVGPTVRLGSGPYAVTPWEVAKVAAPLGGIAIVVANQLLLWETPSQQAARIEREERAEEARRERAEREAHRKTWDDLWKQVDRDFKRMGP
jgi:hypothetical protein